MGSYIFMKYNISSNQLFSNIATVSREIAAKNALQVVDSVLFEGSLEEQVMDGVMVKLSPNDLYLILEKYKEELKKKGCEIMCMKADKTALLNQLEDAMNTIEESKEEVRRLKDEIERLKDKVKFLEEHNRSVTYILGSQHNGDNYDARSNIDIKEIRINDYGRNSQPNEAQEETPDITNVDEETVKICCFIVQGAAQKVYYKSDEKFNEEARLYITKRQCPDVVEYLQRNEKLGVFDFNSCQPCDIYDQLVYDYGELRFTKATFIRNCSGWNPK